MSVFKFLTLLIFSFVVGLTVAQSFVENKGQLKNQFGEQNSAVNFYANYGNFRIFLNQDGFSYEIIEVDSTHLNLETFIPMKFNRVDVSLLNHSFSGDIENEDFVALEKFYSGDNYYQAKRFKKITYKNVYPHIDLVFFANSNGFKYDFIVHPGGDLNAIQMVFNSPFKTALREKTIHIDMPLNAISEQIPYSFLKESNREVAVEFTEKEIRNGQSVFTFAAPNNQNKFAETLVIDPIPNLWFGTYISGNFDEYPENVVLDEEGDIYVVGYTNSVNNIATSGTYQGTFLSVFDVFLVKYRPDGTKMWGTYVGGNSFDRAYGLAYRNGFVYFCGNTFSQNYSTPGVHQTSNMNADDAFLAKFDIHGNRVWCTYFGGEAHDFASSVVVNSNDEIYITGHTLSYTNIATSGVHMESFFGISAAFLAKFSSQGQRIWGTYYGSSFDEGYGIALDLNENIVFSGFTSSSGGIASPGAQQSTNAGGVDAFLTKFTPNGLRLWGTFFGGQGDDKGYDVGIDASNNIYMVGNTSSLSGIASGTGFQQQAGSIDDGFVAKYNANGTRLWSTYIGGSEAEYISSVGLYFDQGIVIGGKTQSSNGIASASALSGNLAGQYDAFMMKISPTGALLWGTYYGGSLSDEITGLAIDPSNGFIHTSGMTMSSDGISTPDAHQTTPESGLFNGFLARFCAPFMPNFITEIQSISCGNSSYSIDVEPANVFANYVWHDLTTTPTYNFTNLEAGQYFYFLSTLDTNNCSFTTDSIFFQVLPDVQINLEILYDPTVLFCQGTEVAFFPNGNFESYAWSNGAQTEELILALNDAGNQSIALTVTDENGCTASDTLFFEVLEAPEPQLQLNGAANFCLGETVLVNTSLPYSSYSWNNSELTSQIEISADAWVWVSVTNSFGCSSASDSILISTTALLPNIVLQNNPPICPNSTLNFALDNVFNNYTWSTGESTNSIEILSESGTHWITVQVENLCGGVGVDTLYYDVLPAIDLTINATIPDLLCIGSLVVVQVSESFTNPLWQNSSFGFYYDEEASQFGLWTISVQALDENSCLVYDTLFLEVDTCVLNLQTAQVELKIYPNPVQNELIVQSNAFQIGKIELFDAQGRLVKTFEANSDYIELDLKHNTSGLYFLKIFDGSGAFREATRIVKRDE